MAEWRTVKRPPADHEALEKLTEASDLYSAYVEISRINVFPDISELELAAEHEEPSAPFEQPIGFVMSPSPTGIALYRRD